MTLGLVCNFHNEPFALPGLIESGAGVFDEMVFISSPPDGVPHHEESIEIIKKSGHRLVLFTVSKGFGVLRTRCLRESSCDWTMVLDADERFFAKVPRLTVEGTEAYPEVANPKLAVTRHEEVDQLDKLKLMLAESDAQGKLALCLSRRHWFDAPGEFGKPCQPWPTIPDWQLRCVKNSPFVFYDPEWKMHEKLLDSRTWSEPARLPAKLDDGVYIDHFHCHFKPKDALKNKTDMETYRALDKKNTEGMWLENAEGVKA